MGISKSYVSDIENGYTGLSIEHINIICNSYNVSFDYMFGFCKKINRNVIKVEKIDLKLLGSHIKEIRKEMEERNIYVPQGRELLASTKILKKKCGI